MTNTEYVLEVINLAKSYGRHKVLKGIEFSMRRGELVGIVGENGAGKSTLLQVLVGLLPPTAGKLTLEGRIGYCPQDLHIFEPLTVRENFRYFAAAYGVDQEKNGSSWPAVKDDLLQRFRFHQYENMLVSRLSGGTKQKLNLSLALLHSPDILILDEPYSGFDWETYLHFWDYAGELQAQGKSILVVSHLVYDRTKFDTLFELKDGVLQCV
jgi:ABC-type multidrug transport system ATPase subunit